MAKSAPTATAAELGAVIEQAVNDALARLLAADKAAQVAKREFFGPAKNRKGDLYEGSYFVPKSHGRLTVRITSSHKEQVKAALDAVAEIIDTIDPVNAPAS